MDSSDSGEEDEGYVAREEAVETRPTPASKADTSQGKARRRLEALLDWSKPYREVIALCTALFFTISGFVVAAINHFATQAALSKLECIDNYKFENQINSVTIQQLTTQNDTRTTLAKELSSLTPPISGTPIITLENDINEITKKITDLTNENQKRENDAIKKCEEGVSVGPEPKKDQGKAE